MYLYQNGKIKIDYMRNRNQRNQVLEGSNAGVKLKGTKLQRIRSKVNRSLQKEASIFRPIVDVITI